MTQIITTISQFLAAPIPLPVYIAVTFLPLPVFIWLYMKFIDK